MRSTLRLDNGVLEWTPTPGAAPDRRKLEPGDEELFRGWAQRYRHTLEARHDPWDDLVQLGTEMVRWLDGGASWLSRAREAGVIPPWLVEVGTPPEPEALEVAFLEAPWEVLSDAGAPLAGNRNLVFCPVRRLGRPGDEEKPSQERLSAVFMTALPEGAGDLQFEEEETALLDATHGLGMDLVVEDSGNLERLGALLDRRVDILHLSCHGEIKPRPCLLTEDDYGAPVFATADDVDAALQPHRPRALFLSACLSAAADQLLGSLAALLVRRGIPNLLGWGGSVYDHEAARFAAELYQRLSRKGRFDESVAWARLALLSAEDLGRRPRDWHQARVFLGATGGGPLTAGDHKRTVKDRRQTVAKSFLDARGQIPVAGPEEFVGRRRDLQRILRLYRDGTTGVVLHGMGRQGKSSLALRVVQRLTEHRAIACYGPFDGNVLLGSLADAVAEPAARELVAKHREAAQDEDTLVDVLVQLLEGFCAQTEGKRRPILFVLDDFEQLLEEADPPPKRLRAAAVEPVRALLRALDRAETDSKLLVTSRFTFTLPWQGRDLAAGLIEHGLAAMRESERRKQLRTKLRLLAASLAKPGQAESLLSAAHGNPGLQDLLTTLAVEDPERAEAATAEAAAHFSGEGEVEDEKLVKFLSNLAIEKLCSLLSPEESELLRASSLFSLPIPARVLDVLGPRPACLRLVGLGLWEVYSPDVEPSYLLSALARHAAGELSEDEERNLAEKVAGPLFKAWTKRSHLQDFELTRLALQARNAKVVSSCAEGALSVLERALLKKEAAALGQRVITFLDARKIATSLTMLGRVAEACHRIGDTVTARSLFGRARRLMARGGDVQEQADYAFVLVSHSRLLRQDGNLEEALQGFEEARELFTSIGRQGDVAVTLCDIARLRVIRGELAEAEVLHEEALGIYELLGDARGRAVALGDVALIKELRGEIDQALTLHRERLSVLEELGEVRELAVAVGAIANIMVDRHEFGAALPLLEKRLRLVETLDDARERLMALRDIARVRASCGEVDVAVALLEEVLGGFESLGDEDGRAGALWSLAQIDVLIRNDVQRGFERLTVAYRINCGLGRLDGICRIGLDLGSLLCATGEIEEGRAILERSLAGFRKLRQDSLAQQVEELLAQLPEQPKQEESTPP